MRPRSILGCAAVALLAVGEAPAIRLLAAQPEQATAEAALEEAHRLAERRWVGDAAARAVAKYEEALAIWRRRGDLAGEALALRGLGELYKDLDEVQKALEALSRSLGAARRAGSRDAEAAALDLLATVHSKLGQYGEALGFAEEAGRMYQAIGQPDGESDALRSAGVALYRLGRHEQAIDRLTRALALARASSDRGGQARSLAFLAWPHTALEAYDRSLAYLEEALPLARATDNQYLEAIILHSMGVAYAGKGALDRAVPFFEQALSIRRANRYAGAELVTRFRLAAAEQRRGRLASARTHVEATLALIETIRQRVTVDDLRASYQAGNRRYYDFYISLLLQMHQAESGHGYDALALETSERARARSLVHLLEERSIDITRGLPAELKERERAIHLRLSRARAPSFRMRSACTSPPTAWSTIDGPSDRRSCWPSFRHRRRTVCCRSTRSSI